MSLLRQQPMRLRPMCFYCQINGVANRSTFLINSMINTCALVRQFAHLGALRSIRHHRQWAAAMERIEREIVMRNTMVRTWQHALDEYRYPVNLSDYEFATSEGPGWFELNLSKGDRVETIGFEKRFRGKAQTHLEAWYEVVFWKLFQFLLLGSKLFRK